MKKIILALLLLFAAWMLYTYYQKEQLPDIGEEYRYSVTDVDDIAEIRINYRLMDPDILLQRQKNGWMLNQKYSVRNDAISNLLNAINNLELKYIPTSAAQQNMLRDLATTGTRVEIINRRGEVMKSYFVGGNTPDETGTFIIMDGSQSPAIANISGLDGSIRPYFIMPEIEWRDRTVFREEYDEISELMVEYPQQASASFVIRLQDNDFEVYPLKDQIDVSKRQVRSGAVEAYLHQYKMVSAEALIDDDILYSELVDKTPFSRITIRRKDGTAYHTAFYPLMKSDGANQFIERYHLIDDKGNLFLVQNRLFGKLFVDLDNFFQ